MRNELENPDFRHSLLLAQVRNNQDEDFSEREAIRRHETGNQLVAAMDLKMADADARCAIDERPKTRQQGFAVGTDMEQRGEGGPTIEHRLALTEARDLS